LRLSSDADSRYNLTMVKPQFIHLRVKSAFSLLEGSLHPKDIARLCNLYAMPAVAVVDRNNMFGAMETCDKLMSEGIQPIIGCLLSVLRPFPPRPGERFDSRLDSLVLLAATQHGYENLVRLLSAANLDVADTEPCHVTFELLEKFSDGIIALTGGLDGALTNLLAEQQQETAELYLTRLQTVFSDRLYIELSRTGDSREIASEDALIDLAYAKNIPLVASNPVLFANPADYDANDLLSCINQSTVIHDESRKKLNPENWFKSPKDMVALFADVPETIANTIVIARRCAAIAPARDPILPKFSVGISEDELLRTVARAGLTERLENFVFTEADGPDQRTSLEKDYCERLEFELDVIINMKFPGYFLIVSDFIQWAKDNGIPVGPGRGSGAGSVVAWSLKITDLDPIRLGLLFERFLNPERVSMPDFDIDFCETRREEVIHYVQEKYGRDHVAQIITFGKMKARAVLKDVGRALQMPYGQMDRLAKLIPNNPASPVTLAEAIRSVAELRRERDNNEDVARMLDVAVQLEGLYRHASTHAAGVVIGDRPLDRLIPLYRDPRSDMAVTQFDMKWVEKAGLVKFDFLGLKTLSVLQRAVDLLKQRGIDIDLLKIGWDDPKVFDLLQRGDTIGVFQLEGDGMRRTLSLVRPTVFEDIIALVALYRPGPMDNIPSFAARKAGREPINYPHPLLEQVLKETYGIPIYQEQVMQIAQIVAGYSLGEADLLRRAMGKKIQSEMDAQTERFVEGCSRIGISESHAKDIFALVDKFAGYGFNKSHAAAYALIAYQTAWLKVNYPVEFFAASMAYDITNTEKLNIFVDDMKRSGIPLLPPDINKSAADFSVEIMPDGKFAVRYALAALKGVGEKAMAQVVEAREAAGPFVSFSELAARIDPRLLNKRQLESLAHAGAFDCLGVDRAVASALVDTILSHAALAADARASSQVSLFGEGDGAAAIEIILPKLADWTIDRKLATEKEAIGFYLSAHPLDGVRQILEANKVIRSDQASAMAAPFEGRMSVTLAGLPEELFVRPGKDGRPFTMLVLSDQAGSFRLGCFDNDIAQAAKHAAIAKEPVIAQVDLVWRPGEEAPRMNARSLVPLSQVIEKTSLKLSIWISDQSALEHIKSILHERRGGHGNVALRLKLNGQTNADACLTLPGSYRIDATVRSAIMGLRGVDEAIMSSA
jgi:DNA polymerase III subunit alpha